MLAVEPTLSACQKARLNPVPRKLRTVLGASLRRIGRTLIATMDALLPKSETAVIRSFPDWDDHARELVKELCRRDIDTVILTVDSHERPSMQTWAHSVNVVPARSIRGVFSYCRARYVFHTHGLYEQPWRSARKVFANVWHGMPVKCLDSDAEVAGRQTDFLAVTSGLHAENFRKLWQVSPNRTVVLGSPRNDILARPRSSVSGERQTIVWLPTYRQSVFGQIRSDGQDVNPFQLRGASLARLEALAEQIDFRLVVKAHPMARREPAHIGERVSVLSDEEFRQRGGALYELLASADLLITDHSSVWIDFLLTQKPIVFAISDMKEYAATRGHLFEPLEDHLPGPLVTEWDELPAALSQALGRNDPWRESRLTALQLHHTHHDAFSASRVVDEALRRGSKGTSGTLLS